MGVPVAIDRLDQILLHAGKIQAGHIVGFAIGGPATNASVHLVGCCRSPTTTIATSAPFAARTASANPLLSVPVISEPRTWVTLALGKDSGPDSLDYRRHVLQDFPRRVITELV